MCHIEKREERPERKGLGALQEHIKKSKINVVYERVK